MPITLESIQAKQDELAAMIAALQGQVKFEAMFPIEVSAPQLQPGEKWACTLLCEDGKTKYHLILLPGDSDSAEWQEQMDWAVEQGGDLPDCVEQAVLFKYLPDEFKKEAYWSNTQHATDAGYAWYQNFSYGTQGINRKFTALRARAVRRIPVSDRHGND